MFDISIGGALTFQNSRNISRIPYFQTPQKTLSRCLPMISVKIKNPICILISTTPIMPNSSPLHLRRALVAVQQKQLSC